MKTGWSIGIVGGHGLVVQSLLHDVKEYSFPYREIVIYGSEEHAHEPLIFEEEEYTVIPLQEENIRAHDLVFFSGNEEIAKTFAPLFVKKGARVIDNSSCFRMEEQVPLVIPEINGNDLLNHSMIYANPNCTVIMVLLALQPLRERYHLEKVYISSYQSASGAGKNALFEYFEEQMNANLVPQYLPSANAVKKPLYDNLLPVVDQFEPSGYTKEEMKIRLEAQKIFHQPKLEVNVTCVRVPTSVGHGASIQAVFEEKVDVEEALSLLRSCPWILPFVAPDYPSLKEVVNTPYVGVGRLRKDLDCDYTLNFFVTSDNLIRGASYNAIGIAKALAELKIL